MEHNVKSMEKSARHKQKTKKQPAAKPKTTKKRKSNGPTCSMFIAELTRRLAAKKKEEDDTPINVVQDIIESITNALPIKISIKTTPLAPLNLHSTASVLENLRKLSPELVPNDTLSVVYPAQEISNEVLILGDRSADLSFKMPKMPVVNSDVIKAAIEKEARRRRATMVDAQTTTVVERDVAIELAKHVGTLRKISLIAEEFNQKTAKNLKEIVDSVQEDLIKKLEEAQAEQRARAQNLTIQEEQGETSNQEE